MASTKQAKMGKVDCMVSWEVKITEQTLALIVFFFLKFPGTKGTKIARVEKLRVAKFPNKCDQEKNNKFERISFSRLQG